ncbi:MAG: NAD-dependent protein deacylase [Firmicutes bacterium]|nr:NAD-dependent protein deacylase [Bacillota bacterium]
MRLKEIVGASNNIVFFGGAGVSTESGIPDFRSVDVLYSQKYDYPPEVILSHTFFINNTEEFYKFYREKLIPDGAEPNITHNVLAELEKRGKLKAVITQNIDGLHQAAGSKNVFELHGSIHRNYCMNCGKFYGLSAVKDSSGIPRCSCGGVIKPDVVLYEEGLDGKTVDGAVKAISNADVLMVGGTSLTVYPAAGFIKFYKGEKLVLINKTPTEYDRYADLVLNDTLGKVMCELI